MPATAVERNRGVVSNNTMTDNDVIKTIKELRSFANTINQTPALHNCCCDVCGAMVVGTRYKCIVCSDFDLCDRCCSTHDTHPVIRIASSKDDSWRKFYCWTQTSVEIQCEQLGFTSLRKYLLKNFSLQHLRQMEPSAADFGAVEAETKLECFDKISYILSIRSSFFCDNCLCELPDARLTCIVCAGYDLCDHCDRIARAHHQHAMVRVMAPDDYSWLLPWILAETHLLVQTTTQPTCQHDHVQMNASAGSGIKSEAKRKWRRLVPSAESVRAFFQVVSAVSNVVGTVATFSG